MPTILIVDDESDIRELIEYNLKKEGFKVCQAANGEEALKRLETTREINLLVLDLMMPVMDGLTLCKMIKGGERGFCDLPIIMLTAKGEEADVITGLESGADDYIVKPFSPKVLSAKIKAVLRRSRTRIGADKQVIRFKGLSIDLKSHEIRVYRQTVNLTLSEYNLLYALADRPQQVFTRTQLLDKISGLDSFVIERNIDVHIASLRKKLGTLGSYISTVRGIGYKISPPEER